MKVGKVVLVSGKVQGVFFRSYTQEQAIELGITGYARNLVDGGVEVVAFGDSEPFDKLLKWLKIGPVTAKVTGVMTKDIEWKEYNHFAIS